jgi:hypothetical protein
MKMVAQGMVVFSAAIALLLGSTHLVYTFFGSKLEPRDPTLQARMSEVSLVLARETTVWRAWIGFNASHSLGMILFGAVYAYLALAHPRCFFSQSVSSRWEACFYWLMSFLPRCIGSACPLLVSFWRLSAMWRLLRLRGAQPRAEVERRRSAPLTVLFGDALTGGTGDRADKRLVREITEVIWNGRDRIPEFSAPD